MVFSFGYARVPVFGTDSRIDQECAGTGYVELQKLRRTESSRTNIVRVLRQGERIMDYEFEYRTKILCVIVFAIIFVWIVFFR